MKESIPAISITIDRNTSIATIREWQPNGHCRIIYNAKITNIIYPNGDYWRAYGANEFTTGTTNK